MAWSYPYLLEDEQSQRNVAQAKYYEIRAVKSSITIQFYWALKYFYSIEGNTDKTLRAANRRGYASCPN
jgi:hypothetical protein